MSLSYEAQLVTLIAALYFFDCCVFLKPDEGVLIATRRKWRAVQGPEEFRLAGRAPYVLSLFTPHYPTFRLRWSFEGVQSEQTSSNWTEIAADSRRIAPFVLVAGLSLFVFLPLGLLSRLGLPLAGFAVFSLYLSIGAALATVRRTKLASEMTRWQFAQFSFECMACPPFGVNLIRRLCLGIPINEAFTDAAYRLVSDEDWLKARARCIAAIADDLGGDDESSDREQLLRSHRSRLESREGVRDLK